MGRLRKFTKKDGTSLGRRKPSQLKLGASLTSTVCRGSLGRHENSKERLPAQPRIAPGHTGDSWKVHQQRRKVRVPCYDGLRIWVMLENRDRFKTEVATLRSSKNVWTSKCWKSSVYKLARKGFGLGAHGHHSLADQAWRKEFGRGSHNPCTTDGHDDISMKSDISIKSDPLRLDPLLADSMKSNDILSVHRDDEQAPNRTRCAEPPCHHSQTPPLSSQPVTGQCIPLGHAASTPAAEYVASGACAVMHAIGAPGPCVPFTPQPVVDWLYQVLGIALSVLQKFLGTDAFFQSSGNFVRSKGGPACGGMLAGVWGTEIGARRDHALLAWDYDVDVAAFITPNFDFSSVWRKTAEVLEPLGLRLIKYKIAAGAQWPWKYRICPTHALAFNDWKERYQLAHLNNPGTSRGTLCRIASQSRSRGEPLQSPSGCNCLDLEVYIVKPLMPLTIRGSQNIKVSCADLFPIVEGIFGPLRIPLPASPTILDAEYGSKWRSTPSAKVITPDGKSQYVDVTSANTRRSVWPSSSLHSCGELLGSFYGAGLNRSDDDVQFRFFDTTKVSIDAD